MILEEYSRVISAFREAFGDECERPGWSECRFLELGKVLLAIARVKANPLTRLYSPMKSP